MNSLAFCQEFTKIKIVEHLWIREVIIYQTGKCYLHHFQGFFFFNLIFKKNLIGCGKWTTKNIFNDSQNFQKPFQNLHNYKKNEFIKKMGVSFYIINSKKSRLCQLCWPISSVG